MAACKDEQGQAVLGLGMKDLFHGLASQEFPGSSFLPFLKMGAVSPFSSHLQLTAMTRGRRIEWSVWLQQPLLK